MGGGQGGDPETYNNLSIARLELGEIPPIELDEEEDKGEIDKYRKKKEKKRKKREKHIIDISLLLGEAV